MAESESSSSSFPFRTEIPEGDNRPRLVCQTCGFIHYVNPKTVVGAVVRHGERILLCKRAIDPRRGFWTLPAGFLEEKETTEEGARREAREEANAEIEIDALLAVYSVPHISHVKIIFRATLLNPDGISAGPESLDIRLFRRDEIPYGELAFSTVEWALAHSQEVEDRKEFSAFSNPPG